MSMGAWGEDIYSPSEEELQEVERIDYFIDQGQFKKALVLLEKADTPYLKYLHE